MPFWGSMKHRCCGCACVQHQLVRLRRVICTIKPVVSLTLLCNILDSHYKTMDSFVEGKGHVYIGCDVVILLHYKHHFENMHKVENGFISVSFLYNHLGDLVAYFLCGKDSAVSEQLHRGILDSTLGDEKVVRCKFLDWKRKFFEQKRRKFYVFLRGDAMLFIASVKGI